MLPRNADGLSAVPDDHASKKAGKQLWKIKLVTSQLIGVRQLISKTYAFLLFAGDIRNYFVFLDSY